MTNEETVTPLGGTDPVHRRNERIQSLLDHAKYALEEQEGLGSVLQSIEDARNLHRQQADAEEGRTAGTSDPTVAERIRGFLEDAEPELAGYLLNGHKPDQTLYAALSDAEEMVTMFGCARQLRALRWATVRQDTQRVDLPGRAQGAASQGPR